MISSISQPFRVTTTPTIISAVELLDERSNEKRLKKGKKPFN